ncbi:MAG: tRNA (guanosine(46)-N7)-methyltransferase TrmB [Cellvibrionales bacterium]|nr:tRNA (guanosine(46)-N7)-methyltransferase TrmB [Cellvibrionales bacterium]
MPDHPPPHPRPVRSFVLRTGRMTAGQRRALAEHWPDFGIDLEAGRMDAAQIFGRRRPLVLEIGFGMGDSLLDMCRAEPDKDFIGVEVHPPGVGHLLARAAAAGIDNLRIYRADAQDVLRDCIADGAIARVQIYFPDPWPKKKHHKRRLLQPDFVAHLAQKVCADGLLHLATDWQNYAEQMRIVLEAAAGWVNIAGPGCYAEPPAWRPPTKFERRGRGLGHGVWELLYRKI